MRPDLGMDGGSPRYVIVKAGRLCWRRGCLLRRPGCCLTRRLLLRAGLLAVPRGQTEAAKALGLGRTHVFLDVVFPQAFKISLPPLVSNFVALLKDSSLAYAIGVVELTNVGNRIQSATFQPIATLTTVAVTYLLLTTLVTQISNAVEYRFDVEGRNQ